MYRWGRNRVLQERGGLARDRCMDVCLPAQDGRQSLGPDAGVTKS